MTFNFQKVKTTRACFLFTIIFSVGVSTLLGQAADFSGNWKINKEKADFGGLSPNSAPVSIIVNQKKDSIHLEKTFNKQDGGTFVTVDNLPLNGNSVESLMGEAKKSASVSWDPGRKSLKFYSFINGTDDDYKSLQSWSLSVDGSTLTITRSDEGKNDKYSLNLIYKRQ